MKKLLMILVMLLWCNVGFAELIEFNKCFNNKPKGAFEKGSNVVWNSWEEFNYDEITEYHNCKTCKKILTDDGWEKKVRLYKGPKYDDVIFSIDPENLAVSQLSILNDEWIKAMETYNNQFKTNDPEEYEHAFKILKRTGQRFTTEPKKYNYEKYTITNFVGGIILAESINEYVGGRLALNIDLKNNQVDYRYYSADEKSLELFDRHDIYFCNKEEGPKIDDNEVLAASSGTGFFVSKTGHIVTNYHVTENCNQVKVIFKDKEVEAEIFAVDKINDLAIIKTNIDPDKIYTVSNKDVSLMQDVIVAGFPLGRDISSAIKTHKGSVTALAGFGDNYSNFETDATINQGNSGGPILDYKGNVVGVAVATWVEEGVQGIHFGIKSSTLKTFANANEITFLTPSNREMSKEKLTQLIIDATVFLECWMTGAKIKQLIAQKSNRKAFYSKYK